MQLNSVPQTLLKAALLSVLRQDYPEMKEIPDSHVNQPEAQRALLGDLLIASNTDWKEETLRIIDEIWEQEQVRDREEGQIVDVNDIRIISTRKGTKVSLFQGDITTIQGDETAIVNAANDQGLGCFAPNHKCIDNVIHRRAGPRLRLSCNQAMKQRGYPLSSGTPPIVTEAFHLPSKYVIHVTGPQVGNFETVSDVHRTDLKKAYMNSLDAAVNVGAKSIVFPCISTGLFGFPADLASEVALGSVQEWIDMNPSNTLDHVVFNTFTEKDEHLYMERIGSFFEVTEGDYVSAMLSNDAFTHHDKAIALAKKWIDDADAVLICAGAGMSVKEGEMVYTNPNDFAHHYPFFTKWGYRTAYECMGLGRDQSVPATSKWAFHAKHMDNMRWKFTPNDGYKTLLELVNGKNYFVLTSNVDGCFERSGFSKNRIYTPQGEWTYLQCMKPCHHDSVFKSRPYIDAILPNISEDGAVPEELLPMCPRCGTRMFGNVRGGSWYLHHKYEEQNESLQRWMQSLANDGTSKVVVLEVGAGFNTPTVTRFPMESFVRELGHRGRLIRINPTEPDVPEDLNAVALSEGWQVLDDIVNSPTPSSSIPQERVATLEDDVRQDLAKEGVHIPTTTISHIRRHLGHFDWKIFLNQLKD